MEAWYWQTQRQCLASQGIHDNGTNTKIYLKKHQSLDSVLISVYNQGAHDNGSLRNWLRQCLAYQGTHDNGSLVLTAAESGISGNTLQWKLGHWQTQRQSSISGYTWQAMEAWYWQPLRQCLPCYRVHMTMEAWYWLQSSISGNIRQWNLGTDVGSV